MGLQPIRTKERASELGKLSAAARKRQQELGAKIERFSQIKAPTEGDLIKHWLDSVFPEPFWKSYFSGRYLSLKRHYAPVASDAPQYISLVQLLAFIETQLARAQALKQPHLELIDLIDRQVKVVQQLQKFTESQKHEFDVRSQINIENIRTFVGLIEAHLTPGQQGPILLALQAAMTDVDPVAALASAPLPIPLPEVQPDSSIAVDLGAKPAPVPTKKPRGRPKKALVPQIIDGNITHLPNVDT